MKYTTKYLKCNSYEDFYAACETAGLVIDGEIIWSSHNHCMIPVSITTKTGNTLTDDDGNEYPETEVVDGYHANLRHKEPVGIEHLAVAVKSPSVEFA